ncbi:hypothetical protein V5T82_14480 [Magnetovibrio sp. PR-2]|uniref:hypothetical protein n=1 Tax=Magnetovibrio sp. PR-2 TaxID=3120356 RepID=UPI002FCDE7E2
MARAPRTSAASFALFKTCAWNQLSNPANAGGTFRHKAKTLLYDNCYTPSLDPALPPKVALQNRALYLQMQGIFTAVGAGRQIRRQRNGAWPVLNAANLATEYQAWADWEWWETITWLTCGLVANPQPAALSHNAQRAMGAYLHVYATGGRVENNNWRIAFNILPQNIAAAVAAMCPVLDGNADIGHFKVSAPGTVGKPDSLIVYMRNNPATYAGIRAAILGAVGGLGMQATFAPMWEEFALGQGEGGEPPRVAWNGGANRSSISFGTYRCILAVMAFDTALANAGGLGGLTQVAFDGQVDQVFQNYGLAPANPHDQQALNFAAGQALNDAFMTAYAGYRGVAGNTYTNVGGFLQDR